jgi:hypothetical protein
MDRGQVVVEQRGSHCVAWERGADGKPCHAVLMVGKTAEEAEARLRAWWESPAHPPVPGS